MSRRPSHLRRYPAKRPARIHPALAVFTAVIAVLGAAAVVTGTVGGLAARHRTSQPVPLEADPTGPSDGWRSDPGPAEPTAGTPTGTGDTGGSTGTGAAAPPARTTPPMPARTGPAARPPAPANGCIVTVKLVPTCGRLWGVAPGAYTDLPPTRALAGFEEKTGRPADILHVYHRGDDLFPTRDERSAADQGGRRRIILANWK